MNQEFARLSDLGAIKLCEAVLIDGILNAFGGRCMVEHTGRSRLVYPEECRESWLWIEEDDESYPFSFINCALRIGLDPFRLRDGLKHHWQKVCLSDSHANTFQHIRVEPLSRADLSELLGDSVQAGLERQLVFQIGLGL